MRTVQFTDDCFYHIYNRGVDKRDIFLDENDYKRFYICLFLFNDEDFRCPTGLSILLPDYQNYDFRNRVTKRTKKLFTDIVAFSLMPNHFHLFVKQKNEQGISLFMHRLQKGYSRYFNIKNKRTGALFEGAFKAVLIEKESYFEHLLRYVHLNPLDFFTPNWREEGIKDWGKAEKFLENYQWSSHNVYLGKPQKLEIVSTDVFKDIFKTPEEYLNYLKSWATKDWGVVKGFSLRENFS